MKILKVLSTVAVVCIGLLIWGVNAMTAYAESLQVPGTYRVDTDPYDTEYPFDFAMYGPDGTLPTVSTPWYDPANPPVEAIEAGDAPNVGVNAIEDMTTSTTQPATSPADAPAATGSYDAARSALDALTIADESHTDDYDRDTWNLWISMEGNSCWTVREQTLIDEAVEYTLTDDQCDIDTMTLVDPYIGETISYNQTVDGNAVFFDTDHMVPLKEAHISGGWAWDEDKKEAYANDLANPQHLINTYACLNRQKSASDPASWLPHSLGPDYSVTDGCSGSNFDARMDGNNDGRLGYSEYFEPYENAWCEYVKNWVEIKTNWGLTVDATEYDTMRTILDAC